MVSPTIDRRFGLVGNASIKAPVLVVATGNITMSGEQTIDGTAVHSVNASSVPDRVLCVGQIDTTQNGIYDVSTAAWSRSADADGIYDFAKGSTVFVTDGTAGAGSYWQLTTTGSIVPGSTAMTWVSVLVGINTALAAANADAAAAHVDRVQSDADAVATGLDRVATANYAAAAATGAKFYNTIALGNAGVADAATFGVIAGGSDGLTRPSIYRRESAGVSTALYSVLPASEYDGLFPTLNGVTPVWGISDDRGNALALADTAGSLTVANLVPLQTNGLDQRYRSRPASLGNFDAELMVFIAEGQSNCGGRVPGVTLTQEYDNIGFAPQASSPVSTLALNVLNCGETLGNAGGVAECILFGALGYIKLLLQQENGLSITDVAFQLLGADNSAGGTSISAHVKGSANYGYGTSQATSAVTIAAASNRSVAHGGVFWNQGESDSATSLAAYQTALQLLATNYNTDLKAITGQAKDITLITAQTTSNTGNRNIALAQLAAANASSLIKMCTPMYQFDYDPDGIHVVNRHDYWMGAYYGLVWKRLWVDLLAWHAVQPLSSTKSGKVAYVTFDCMVQPLVLDTSGVPAQTNYGFTMVDSGGSDLPISSVSVCAPNKVKVVAASSIPAGAKLRYGFNAATGKGAYTGAAGNLRDSQGLCVPTANGYTMHNWCAVFEFAL